MQSGAFKGGVEQHGVQLVVVLDVQLLLALPHLVQRRLRDVDVAALDQVGKLPVEERQQQSTYVASVDISICIVRCNTAHASDEILIAVDREVVDKPTARGHRLDLHDT